MVQTVISTTNPAAEKPPAFPCAPVDWSLDKAVELAKEEGLSLTEEHVKVLLDLQDYFFHHEERINLRELHDALRTDNEVAEAA